MKRIIELTCLLSCTCFTGIGQTIPIPDHYTIIDSIKGDLDGDNIDELVVAYNTQTIPEDNFESIPRELFIYKKGRAGWSTWKRSKQALLGSRDGGMMGDPFESIEIVKGILKIAQSGGSSWKWGNIDKYRYQQGEFYLIGHQSTSGKLCEYWMNVDFNLVTGKVLVTKEFESCEDGDQKIYKRENESMYKKGIRITLEKRNAKTVLFITPKYKHDIYIASPDEK